MILSQGGTGSFLYLKAAPRTARILTAQTWHPSSFSALISANEVNSGMSCNDVFMYLQLAQVLPDGESQAGTHGRDLLWGRRVI